jgi:probable F420-dependent oxidoreductase
VTGTGGAFRSDGRDPEAAEATRPVSGAAAALEDIRGVGIWGHLDSLPAADVRTYVASVGALGYRALWVPETVGREPFTLLGAVAEVAAPRLWLGTSIASIYARDAVTARLAAMTLQELTEARFVLGLGVSHPHLVTKVRGHEYGRPVSAMREYIARYRAVPYRGPLLAEDGEPPVLVAALRDGKAHLAATEADGAFPYLVTEERVAWLAGRLHAAAFEAGHGTFVAVTLAVVLEPDAGRARAAARAYLAPYVRTPTYQASWAIQGFEPQDWERPGSDRLVDAMVAWGDVDRIVERVAAMLAAGADHVALIPLSPGGLTEHRPTIEALAGGLAWLQPGP